MLPSWHYAAQWPLDQRFTSEEMTELGRSYHSTEDPAVRQEIMLELIRRFHPYLMKYLMMISRGRLPENTSRPDSDTHQFLRVYLKPGEAPTPANLARVCRRLHLAFKGMQPSEIYDVLVALMTEAILRWDPDYSRKIRQIVEAIGCAFAEGKEIVSSDEISAAVGFDCLRYCQRLAGYRILEPAGKTLPRCWKAGLAWPPSRQFLESGTIGLTYVAIRWFRWLLQRYITRRMNELEHANDVMQLGVRRQSGDTAVYTEEIIPHELGDLVSVRTARRWSADMTLSRRGFDLGRLSLEWVERSRDPLFRNLTRMERFFLFAVFRLGFSWSDLAKSTGMKVAEAEAFFHNLIGRLQKAAAGSE